MERSKLVSGIAPADRASRLGTDGEPRLPDARCVTDADLAGYATAAGRKPVGSARNMPRMAPIQASRGDMGGHDNRITARGRPGGWFVTPSRVASGDRRRDPVAFAGRQPGAHGVGERGHVQELAREVLGACGRQVLHVERGCRGPPGTEAARVDDVDTRLLRERRDRCGTLLGPLGSRATSASVNKGENGTATTTGVTPACRRSATSPVRLAAASGARHRGGPAPRRVPG